MMAATGVPRLRAALAGAGMVSRHHLIAWSKLPGARVVAIADPDRARAEARAAEFGIPAVFADAETMLEKVAADALDIAAPVAAHAGLCRLAAAHGLAILCQKPLCPTLAEARSLVAELSGRVPFMVHENWRFRPPYRTARAWLLDARLGRLVSAQLAFRSSGLLADRPALTRQPFLAELPRLIVFETLIHHLDVLRCLLGPLAVRGAVLARRTEATRGEDTAAVLLADASGAPVLCCGTKAAHAAPPFGEDRLEIIGTRGVVRFAGSTLSLVSDRPESLSWSPEAIYQGGFDAAVAHFVAALAADEAFETSAEDNLATLALVEDAYCAAGAIPSTRR